MNLDATVRSLIRDGGMDLPLPGGGRTAARLATLAGFARRDVSLGRLAEAHTDAVAILAEAGRAPAPGAWYGVWASESPTARLAAHRDGDGTHVTGAKAFCTGASLVDRALVTAWDGERRLLLDLPIRGDDRIDIDPSGWVTAAFAATATATVTFHAVRVPADGVVGGPDFYLDRPGFWHGALAPAACWAGGALGLIDHVVGRPATDAHGQAHRGALAAAAWSLEAVLRRAGDDVDAEPTDAAAARRRALAVRHLVEDTATAVLDRFGRACGPRPLAFDRELSRRHLEVALYVRQSHAERDLEALGRALEPERWGDGVRP